MKVTWADVVKLLNGPPTKSRGQSVDFTKIPWPESMMKEHTEYAKNCYFFGQRITELTREQLIVVAAYQYKEQNKGTEI